MLKLTAFEFIIRTIPEVLLFIFATYAFSKTKIDRNKYLLSSLLLAISVFFIRMLPINYGVHTIMNIVVQTIIVISISKINVVQAVKSAIMTAILLFACEGINVAILNIIFGDQITSILQDATTKTVLGLPSLIVFAIVVMTYYYYLKKKEKFEYV